MDNVDKKIEEYLKEEANIMKCLKNLIIACIEESAVEDKDLK